MRRFARFCIAAIALSLAAAVVRAGEPSALVLDLQGETAPPIELFEELSAGTTVGLVGDSVITISHYATCRDVTLRGGQIQIEATYLSSENSVLLGNEPGSCPAVVALAPADLASAAIVMRSSRRATTVAPRPRIVISGLPSGSYDTMAVIGPDGLLAKVPVHGRGARWPADAPPGVEGDTYTLMFTGPAERQRAARIRIAADGAPIAILRP